VFIAHACLPATSLRGAVGALPLTLLLLLLALLLLALLLLLLPRPCAVR
jgi:hypothetical protein